MTDVLAVANQKGGVAKTTTVQSLGVASAEMGRRTLVVDLDPQACLTYSMGFDPDALNRSLHDVFVRRAELAEVILPVPGVADLDLVPATIDLAGSEVHLLTRTGREHVLERALEPVLDRYDLVLIDCPPSLGVLTINGLTAADAVLIPLQCEALSHRGVGQLLETIEDVRTFANSGLSVRGIVATMYDDRTRHARHILEEVQARYGIPVLQPPVRKSIRFAEAPARGKSILQHAPNSPGAVAYRQLARTILETSVVAGTGRIVARGPDPLGKRALFWMPVDAEVRDGPTRMAGESAGRRVPAARQARPAGKQALYSEATPASERETATGRRRPRTRCPAGLFVVACSTCGSVSRVGLIEFLWCNFPSGPGCPRRRSTGG